MTKHISTRSRISRKVGQQSISKLQRATEGARAASYEGVRGAERKLQEGRAMGGELQEGKAVGGEL